MMQRSRKRADGLLCAVAVSLVYVVLVLLLAGLGMAMMISAGRGNLRPWALPQIIRFAGGFIGDAHHRRHPIRLVLRYSYVIYFLCLAMLVIVEVIGHIGMGAQRELSIGFVNLQPSELMKIALVLALARYFHGLRRRRHRRAFLIPAHQRWRVPADAHPAPAQPRHDDHPARRGRI